MIPPQFDYVRPANLDEALAILRDREGAKVLAGGYSLLPLLKLRLASPEVLVDIGAIAGMDGIAEVEKGLHIGGRATHRSIHENAAVKARYPLLEDAAAGIGDPQIRNWGTMGGSVAHADPSADWPAVLIASRAAINVRSAGGDRWIDARDFFIDSFQTAIEPNEILTEIRVPAPGANAGGAYAKLERRAGDFSTVGVAVQLNLGADGQISAVGIGLTAVAPTPFAATDAEAILMGATPDEATFRRAGDAAAAQSSPTTDAHGPAEYKKAMVSEMVVRALRSAVSRARKQA